MRQINSFEVEIETPADDAELTGFDLALALQSSGVPVVVAASMPYHAAG